MRTSFLGAIGGCDGSKHLIGVSLVATWIGLVAALARVGITNEDYGRGGCSDKAGLVQVT